MVKYVCVYGMGEKFGPRYVLNLKSAVERHGNGRFEFVCLTNDKRLFGESWAIPLLRPRQQGWWVLPEKFRITGPVVFSGLDTLILDDISPLADLALECPEDEVYMIHPFRLPNKGNRVFANGMMVWNTDLTYMFEDYDYTVAAGCVLEQDYTSAMLIKSGKDIRVLQKRFPGIHSWKVTLNRGAPRPDTKIVLFHGNPGVHQLQKKQWVKDNWC